MITRNRIVTVAVVAALALALEPARTASAQPAAAELTFKKARALLKEGKIAEACDAFAQSQHLDPQLGTEYNLGLCWDKLGKTASAWLALREVAQRDTNPARKAHAAARASELEPMLVKASLAIARVLPGLVITSNGDDITKLAGVEFPIDPGSYQIVARAPGHRDYTTTIVAVGAGTTIAIEIPPLAELPEAPAVTPLPPQARTSERPAPMATAPRSGHRKTIGIVTASAGGVAIAAGVLAGVFARAKWNAAQALCGAQVTCASEADYTSAQHQVDAARLRGNLATGLVALGVAAAGVGVVLWVTAPHAHQEQRAAWRVAPTTDGRSFAVALDGRF
ncbi:MAG TPA: hypothetical protein VHN14_20670 [Kofleriaceae bacterium]|jgi:hypothetical protein|nr:hypothetical protein [Kofleriaceae bacterium]